MTRIIALLLTATAAHAEPCAPHDVFAVAIDQRYGEKVQVQAVSDTGNLMEVWANPATGTWTATMTDPAGVTCLRASGTHFKATPPGDPA